MQERDNDTKKKKKEKLWAQQRVNFWNFPSTNGSFHNLFSIFTLKVCLFTLFVFTKFKSGC